MVKVWIKAFLVIMLQIYHYEILSKRFPGLFTVTMDIQRKTSIIECKIRGKRIRTTSDECSTVGECASFDLILQEYKKVVKRSIEAVKGEIRRRRFIIAIDETHEPFFGKIKNLWIHDYRNGVKGATGSYKYIVVSIVPSDLRFFLVIPIPKISMEGDYYVRELLIFVKSFIPIEMVLLDRGFYAWGVINVLQELKLVIIFIK